MRDQAGTAGAGSSTDLPAPGQQMHPQQAGQGYSAGHSGAMMPDMSAYEQHASLQHLHSQHSPGAMLARGSGLQAQGSLHAQGSLPGQVLPPAWACQACLV